MDKVIAGTTVDVNEEGYLTNLEQWNREVAAGIAAEEGVELSEQHWEVLAYLQERQKAGEAISIRSLGKHGPVTIKELYELFPDGPLKKASKIAGIPKPSSCL